MQTITTLLEALKNHSTYKVGITNLAETNKNSLFKAMVDTSRLDYLRLSQCSLNKDDLEQLALVLMRHPTLKTLILEDNHINGFEILFAALATNHSLKELNLQGNYLGKKGMALLVNWLETNQSLEELTLFSTYVGDDTRALTKLLAIHPTLTYVNIGDNHLQLESVQALAETLMANPRIITLKLGLCALGAAGISLLLPALKIHPSIKYLDIRRNKLKDEGAEVLAELLKANTELLHLDCRFNLFNVAGFRALAEGLSLNKHLSYLNISHFSFSIKKQIMPAIATSLLSVLAKHPALSTLKLVLAGLNYAEVPALTHFLSHNIVLKKLDISKNDNLAKKGAMPLIATAMQHNDTLRKINIKGIKLDTEALTAWLATLQVNHSLTTIKGLSSDETLVSQINFALVHNKQAITKARDNFVETCIILARAYKQPHSLCLPPEIWLNILSFLCFGPLHKTSWTVLNPGQAYYCAMFIFNHTDELNQRLCYAYGSYPLIKEKKIKPDYKTSLQAFSFFKPVPSALSKETSELVKKHDVADQTTMQKFH